MPRMEFADGGIGRPIQPRLSDLAQRRDWLKQARVDGQLVGGWTDVYGYELPAAEGADWARFYNEHMKKDAAALNSVFRARHRAAAGRQRWPRGCWKRRSMPASRAR